MIAKDNPDTIQVLRNGAPVVSAEAETVINLAQNWDTKRAKAKNKYLEKMFSPELRRAIREKAEKKSPPGVSVYTAPVSKPK